MKTVRKILCVLISAMLLFSLVSIGASAAVNTENTQTVSQEDCFFDGIRDAIEKLKNFFLGIIEKLRTIIGIGYSKTDVRDYASSAFSVPGLDEDFIPQGICYVKALEKFAVSGYVKGDNSRIYLVDAETGKRKKLVIKNFTQHAGGIASDGNDVWVSSGGSETEGGFVYHISAAVLGLAPDGAEIEFDGSFQTECSGSTVFCDGEKLIVAEFYERNDYIVNEAHAYGENHAWACGYDLPVSPLSYNGKKLTPDFVLSIPDKVQGISLTDEGNVVFSSSYGRKNDSTLYIYAPFTEWEKVSVGIDGKSLPMFVPTGESLVSKLKMPTLMEGIDFENGKLYVVFESGAKTYSDAKEIITDVWAVDMPSLMSAVK